MKKNIIFAAGVLFITPALWGMDKNFEHTKANFFLQLLYHQALTGFKQPLLNEQLSSDISKIQSPLKEKQITSTHQKLTRSSFHKNF
ncbi:MAG: hypothetical protein ACOYT8_05185 [Candidatus Dependentiae bacterium]